MLSTSSEVEVVGTAGDGEEAVAMVTEHEPDIVLMDVSMPGMDGMEATRRVIKARPDTRVVMVTSFSGHERIKKALDSGAVGYVLKEANIEELVKAIRSAFRSAADVEDL